MTVRELLSTVLGLSLIVILAAPAPTFAQEAEEGPETLVISQWKCDYQHMEEIRAEVDSVALPIWQDMVDQGHLDNVGTFYHEWGDSWNVNVYYVAEDKAAFFDAFEMIVERYEEATPEGEDGAIAKYCTEHKDNIYQTGQSTEEQSGGS